MAREQSPMTLRCRAVARGLAFHHLPFDLFDGEGQHQSEQGEDGEFDVERFVHGSLPVEVGRACRAAVASL